MAWIISGILLIIIIILIVNKNKQVAINKADLEVYQEKINQLKNQKQDLLVDVNAQQKIIEENNYKIKLIKDEINKVELQYNNAIRDRTKELDTYFDELREQRQQNLDETFEKAKKDNENAIKLQYENLITTYEGYQNEAAERADCAVRASKEIIAEAYERATNAIEGAKEEEEKFEAILIPLQQYEKDRQERLFYTIQVPDEYKEDINFLINIASQKVQHPDIINKLVWSEYVKPYLDDTFKRIGIKDQPGIYKLTNLESGKSYIGKSTNVKKRIADHYKASIGIKSIAWQAVHDEIWRTGYWNWTIEVIIYCDKDKLSELEKYYINFFKTNSFGFNRTSGGEG